MKRAWEQGSMGAWVLLALTIVGACAKSDAGEQAAAPELGTVEKRDLNVSAEAAGLVEPIQLVEIKSKASGEVMAVNVETGQEVERGVLLVQVEPRDVRNALAQAEADLEVAQARAETSGANRRRVQELRKSNVATEQELETAVLDEANARAQLIKAQTNLELARERMNDVTIRAPLDGTIIEKTVEPGSIIASASGTFGGGTTLLKMADLSVVQVRAMVDQTDIGKVEPGQSARVTVEAYPGRPFNGQVVKVEPSAVVEQNVTMFPVLIHLRNDERLLKPGMNTEVEIEIAERTDVAVIPNDAVVALRDATTAASALGISEDAMNEKMEALRSSMQSQRVQGGAGGPGGPGEQRRGQWSQRGQSSQGPHGSQRSQGSPTNRRNTARPGIVFLPGSQMFGGVDRGEGVRLTVDDANALLRAPQNVKDVSPSMRRSQQVEFGGNNASIQIEGVWPSYFEINNHAAEHGRFFTAGENQGRRRVALVGARLGERLNTETSSLMGKTILIRGIAFDVIGVLQEKGQSSGFGSSPDERIYIPLATAQFRIFGQDRVNEIQVQAHAPERMAATMAEIEKVLRREHRMRPGDPSDFNIRNQANLLQTFEETTRTMNYLLAGIAIVSLVVGGIGIMNIMLVSVTERTREIGVRKALGARRRDILLQFMIEALVLCLAGGILGLGVGVGAAVLMAKLAAWNTVVAPEAAILAITFSAVIGVFFGMWPARRAAALDPVVSLRYE